jgi:hypothetical protein
LGAGTFGAAAGFKPSESFDKGASFGDGFFSKPLVTKNSLPR